MSDSLWPHGLHSPWNSIGQDTEWVAFLFFSGSSNPGIEPRSAALQADSLPAEPQGKSRILEWVDYPFSSRSSDPGVEARSPALQGDSLRTELSGKPCWFWCVCICLSLLQSIFPIQQLNPDLPQCRWILYQLTHKGSPRILEWVAYPFSRGSFQ